MQLLILADAQAAEEWVEGGTKAGFTLTFITTTENIENLEGSALVDLQFEPHPHRIAQLKRFRGGPVLINSVTHTLAETDPAFVRINGWPGFLSGTLVEAAAVDEEKKAAVADLFRQMDREITWLPDQVGFVTPRVVASIINEAYLALEEGVSTREEIDTAMRLGTNYPHGPFEWADRIGLANVSSLLKKLSAEKPGLVLAKSLNITS